MSLSSKGGKSRLSRSVRFKDAYCNQQSTIAELQYQSYSKCVWTWCILGCPWSWTQLMNVCYTQCFLCLDTSIEIQDKFIFHQGWKDIVSHQRNRFLIEKLLQISLFLSNLVLIVTHRVLCLLWVLAGNRFWVVASVPPHAENDVAKELF